MILTHRSSAWLLAGMQTLFAILFSKYLLQLPGMDRVQIFAAPPWLNTLLFLLFGLALLLALCALWKFEICAMVLLLAIHLVCPILFFTDLTRNPYFTQIILLNIWLAFLWIAWLWECFKNKKIVFPKTALDLPLFCFLAIVTISWLVSFLVHDKSFYPAMFWEGLKRWLFTIVNCIAVFYIAVTIDEKWRKRFLWTTFAIGGVASIYGLMQFYGIEQVWKSALTPFGNRPVSTFGNPNFLSSYLLLLVPLLAVTLLTVRDKFVGFLSTALLLIVLAGIVATMTRSTWVGTLVALSLFLWLAPVKTFIAKHKTLLAIIALLFVAYLAIWPKSKLGVGYDNPFQRLIELQQIWEGKPYQPWHQRILIWSSCFRMIQDHLFFGKGWGLLELFYPYYQGEALFVSLLRPFRTHANNAHNEMLEIWSQSGFLGMGIYVWFWLVIFFFGKSCANFFAESSPEKSLWAWAFTAGSMGMLADNFFGNVSIHFAVPAFLFWWQLGLLFSLPRQQNQNSKVKPSPPSPLEWHLIPMKNYFQKLLLCAVAGFFLATCIFNFRREFQEIYYFLGFKISKTSNLLEQARAALETAWRWYPREVNTNYELANTYARLSYQSHQAGLAGQSEDWRKKAIWGYMESLRSNCGYDEIYFNLGTVLSQAGWSEDHFSTFTVSLPGGLKKTELASEIKGAIANLSRAIAINPLSQEAYHLLGNLFLQRREPYREEAIQLYRQAAQFFPENKEVWVNLTFLHREGKNFEEASAAIKKALAIDPFYGLARNNLRALVAERKMQNDPLLRLDLILSQLLPFIQSSNWPQLKTLCEQAVKILPESFQIRFMLANTLYELKEWEKAEKEYLEALKLAPQNLTVLNNLALTYRSQNKLQEAKKLYQKILSLKPDDANAKTQLQLLQ